VIGGSVEISDGEVTKAVGDWRFTPISVAGDSNGLFTEVSFSLMGLTKPNNDVGLFVLDQRPSTSPGSAWSRLLAFCLEPDRSLMNYSSDNVATFNNPYTVKSLTGAGYASASGAINELWGRYYSFVNSDTTAAAFQVTLWELAYGTTDRNLSTGHFVLNTLGLVRTTAEDWLTSLDGSGPMAQGLVVLQDDATAQRNNQDLLAQGQVPEPGMLGLLAAGLVGLGLARRSARRQRQA